MIKKLIFLLLLPLYLFAQKQETTPTGIAPALSPQMYIKSSDSTLHFYSDGKYYHAASVITSITPTVIPFTTSSPAIITISNWATTYAALYGNGKFTVQYKIATAPDQIQEVAIFPIRTKDTATNTFQNTVSFDFGLPPSYSGQIIIQYSNISNP